MSRFVAMGRNVRDADDNAQFRTAFFWLGLAAMIVAIVMQFGWLGVLFCVGAVLLAAGVS